MQYNQLPTIQSRPTAHERMQLKQMRLWARLRHELLYITWALMEVALIVPTLFTLLQWDDWSPVVVSLGVLAMMLLPFYLARFMTWLKLPLVYQQRIMITVALITILWVVRTLNYEPTSLLDFGFISQFFTNLTVANSNQWQQDLGLFALITLAWWRGTVLVTRVIDVVRFGQRFRRSSLYIAPFIILLAHFRLNWSIVPFIMLFFLAGLTAVSLTRAEQAELEQQAIVASISPRWLANVLGLSVVITFTANVLAQLISGSFGRMGSLLQPIWQALRFGGTSVGLTILYLVSPLLNLLDWLFNLIIAFWQWTLSRLFVPVENPMEETPAEDVADQFQRYLLEQQQNGGDWIINWRIVLLIVLIIALIAAVYALGRYYNKNKVTVQNGRFSRIIDTIRSQLGRGDRQKRKREKEAPFDWKTAVTIQRIYEQMALLAAKLNKPREQFQTPYEYLPTLITLWPDHKADVQKITTAYVKVRYGELPENQEELNQIIHAWKRIETISTEHLPGSKTAF